jgi:hypothetical protein
MAIKRLVIDVLIPHEPSEIDYAVRISELEGIDGTTISAIDTKGPPRSTPAHSLNQAKERNPL